MTTARKLIVDPGVTPFYHWAKGKGAKGKEKESRRIFGLPLKPESHANGTNLH